MVMIVVVEEKRRWNLAIKEKALFHSSIHRQCNVMGKFDIHSSVSIPLSPLISLLMMTVMGEAERERLLRNKTLGA